MSYDSRLAKNRSKTAFALAEIAAEIEAGRAATPFQKALKALTPIEVDAPIRVALLADSSAALHSLLSEIVGHDYNVCTVVVPSRLGYSEIFLQERGFALDDGTGPRDFPDVDSFLRALESSQVLPGVNSDTSEPIRFKLMGPAQLSGLCLLVPQSLDSLLRKPALLSTLTDQADWVFLAGGEAGVLTEDQRQAVQLVLDHVTGLQNVLITTPPSHLSAAEKAPSASSAPAGAAVWHHGWRVGLSLGLVRQGSDRLRERLSMLTSPKSELRSYLVEVRLWRQLESTIQLMEEELAQASRSLNNHLHLAREGLLSSGDAAQNLRKAGETLRARLAEDGESLLKATEREAKSALGVDGSATRRLREAAQALTVEDIEQTSGEAAIRLTLDARASHQLSELVETIAQTRLTAELKQIHEGFECSVRDAEAALEQATGLRHRLPCDLPDEVALRATLVATRPELRYRGEMPKATLGARFGSARQLIMGLMIAGTLVGGIGVLTGDASPGGGPRALISAIMLPMLVLGFLWTYISFRKKERLTLVKELDKLHEGVATELRRVLQDIFRDQQAALAAALQRAQRSVQTEVETALEKTAQLRQREIEDARKRQAEQERSVEQRSARLRHLAQQLLTVKPNLTQARELQAQWLSAWIDQFNQEKI
ncbi:MAG: hypothetical protein ACNA77_07175 [Opitutales bacterium]